MLNQHIGLLTNLLTMVKQRKLRWYGHIMQMNGLARTLLQGTVDVRQRRDRPRKCWLDNITE